MSVFVVSVRNINICERILTQFTGLLLTNTLAAKRDLLAERTGLGKSVSVSLRKNGPQRKFRCRSARKKKAQILKILTSRRRYVQIPGDSVSVSLVRKCLRIHLLKNMVDIDSRWGWNRPSIWIHTKKKSVDIDCRCALIPTNNRSTSKSTVEVDMDSKKSWTLTSITHTS